MTANLHTGTGAPPEDPPYRIGRARSVLRVVAIASCLPYTGLKTAWTAGSRIGIPDGSPLLDGGTALAVANGATVLMDGAVVVLALLLTRPWGLRVPAWLLVLPMWVASGLLLPIMTAFPVQLVVRVLGGGGGRPVGEGSSEPFLDPWVFGVVYGGFIVQGIALGSLFALYARERWGDLWRGRLRDLPESPTAPALRATAVAAASAALVPGVAHLLWATGSTAGLEPARAADRTSDFHVLEAVSLLFVVVTAVGVLLLAFRRTGGLSLRLPLVLAWCGSAQMASLGRMAEPRRADGCGRGGGPAEGGDHGDLRCPDAGRGARRDAGRVLLRGARGGAFRVCARRAQREPGVMRFLAALFGRRARLRWLHLIIGGALLMPYFLVGTVLVGMAGGGEQLFSSLPAQFVAFGLALPMAAVTGFFGLVRPLPVAAARALCGVPPCRAGRRARPTRQARVRTAGWYTLHLALGGIISGATLALPPFAVAVIALPFFAGLRETWLLDGPEALREPWALALAPFAGSRCCWRWRWPPPWPGGAAGGRRCCWGRRPRTELAAAERRAADLAVRNRLARELHDSVGHALSAVTLQAGAARRVLDRDPEFVREALTAIEETTRRTVGELDSVLGLLRQDGEPDEEVPYGPGLTRSAGCWRTAGCR